MLSMSFDPHMIIYKPPRGFLVLKFTMYDGTSDSFDHLLHYRQLMTLDIGNDVLFCKVFSANPHEHGHITEQCKNMHYLVQDFIKAGHLKQYVYTSAPKAVIDYIYGGPVDDKYHFKRQRQRLVRVASVRGECISFSVHSLTKVDPTYEDALVLKVGVDNFDVHRILINPRSSINLLQMSAYRQMGYSSSTLENPGRILISFNKASIVSIGDVVLPVQVGPVTLNVYFLVVDDLSSYNAIMGHVRQVDLLHNQLVVRQCYHVTVEVGQTDPIGDKPESTSAKGQKQL
uniref:Uncharacterized protein n=1 Tax=Vitis vinifera TaxID=29760 RepID=A5BDC2_VITVI|nr:hypothetical protein VITISV_029416 [Vitis vinifera]